MVKPRRERGVARRRFLRGVGDHKRARENVRPVLLAVLATTLAATGLLGFTRPAAAVVPVAEPRVSAPGDVVVGEGDGFVDLPVTLSAPGLSVVTVGYRLSDSTAVAGPDYVCPTPGCGTGTLTFTPGETSKTVHVELANDVSPEGMETFLLNLSTPTNATIARAHAHVTIIDNDTVVATPQLFVRGAVVDESAGTASIPVLMGGPRGQRSNKTVTVDYATADGTATAGTDYTATSGTLSFAPGQTVRTVVVPITNDTAREQTESFRVTLATPLNATIGDATGTVVIGGNDGTRVAQPLVSVAPDLVVGEGDGYVDVPVRLSAPGQLVVSVGYRLSDGTAAAFSDYDCTTPGCGTDTLTFAPGETTKTVRVDLLNDTAAERLETFLLTLSAPANATIARANGHVTTIDNDTVVPTPRLFVRDAVVDETAGTVTIPVLVGGPGGQASNRTVTVDFATGDGSATGGLDYTATSGTLSFPPGASVENVVVPVTNDTAREPAESFHVTLSNPINATVADAVGTVVIGANDGTRVAQPMVSVGPDLVVGEGDGYVDLPVSLSAPGQSVVTVGARLSDGTAAAFSDYDCATPGCGTDTLTFAPGETTKIVRVDLRNDVAPEGMETFLLNLSAPTNTPANSTIARAHGHVTIIDNDTVVATPRLLVRDAVVDETVGTVSVPVLMGGPIGRSSNRVVTVDYTTADGTAAAGTDYTATAGTLTFPAGSSVKNIVIPITNDTALEAAETFQVTLTNPLNAILGDATGNVLIGANDGTRVAQPQISAAPDVRVGEAAGYLDVRVSLSAPGQSVVTVGYSLASGTALAFSDFDCTTPGCGIDTMTFAPGETTKTVRIDILNDLTAEPAETFLLNLATPTSATILRGHTQVTIVDND